MSERARQSEQTAPPHAAESETPDGALPVRKPVYDFCKRIIDILLAAAGGVVLALPLAVLAAAVAVRDPGNPFYFHQRVGKGGAPIKVLKLRTMKKGADNVDRMLTPEQLAEYRHEFKLCDDPRLIGWNKPGDGTTCFGAKLRRLSLDEVPQIYYNVLFKGDMSFVGPRPVLPCELEKYYTPQERELLLSVMPGITGFWQAYARNDASYTDGRRQRMELYYVRHRSFLLDLRIMFATVGAVWHKRGAK